MLIIPAENKLDWRSPPLITILLIAINCAIFFLYQGKDNDRYESLIDHYNNSQFKEQEISLYTEYLSQNKPLELMTIQSQDNSEDHLIHSLLHDQAFEQSLRQQKGFSNSDWETFRLALEEQRNSISYIRFGFNPDSPDFISAFISMFLHGSFGHLLGNMIFLFIFGCALEAVIGRAIYLGAYLLTGFCATGLYWLAESGNHGFGVGASGAIAGLMGLYIGVYKARPIQFFYWIGPYFNFLKAPALIVFPIWLGKEILGQASSTTNINYWAHMGGLISGVCLPFFAQPLFKPKKPQAEPEEPKETRLLKDLSALEKQVNELHFDEALLKCEKLLKQYPHELKLLKTCYLLRKRTKDRAYHQLILHIIKLPKGREYDDFIRSISAAYCSTPLLLKKEPISSHWINRLIAANYFEEARLLTETTFRVCNNHPDSLKPIISRLMRHYQGINETQYKALTNMLDSIAELET